MNPIEAIRSVLTQPVRFTGRASRSEFWWFALFETLLIALAEIIDASLQSPVLVIIVGVLLLLPFFSVCARRLQDTGRSGWWVFIQLLPFIGVIWLLVLCAVRGEPGPNRYGPSPKQPAAAGSSP